jgi:hypothetical protein
VRALAERSLAAYAEEPDAVAFVIAHQTRFIGSLPADFPYPIRVMERLIAAGQRDGSVRAGPLRLLASLVFGCIVQPLRTHAEALAGTIDLRARRARELIADAAWRAIAAEPARPLARPPRARTPAAAKSPAAPRARSSPRR